MIAHQHELSDEQGAKIEAQAKQMEEKQLQMAEKYQREPIFLSYPGDTNTVYFLDGKKVKAENEDDKTTIRMKTK